MQNTFIANCLSILEKYWPSFLLGIQTTLIISISGTLIGLLIGLIVGGFRAAKLDTSAPKWMQILKRIFDILTKVYIDVFRGTPMMVQAVFLYYALLNIVHWGKMTAAIFVISVNTGAYMAEIIRGGIQAVDPGQTEAARSLGMSNRQTMMNVILPQAVKNAFPAIGNELIVNIKDSSVLMIISIADLMFQAKSIAGSTYHFTETYFVTAAIYFILTTLAAVMMNTIEKRWNRTTTSLPQSMTSVDQMKYATSQKGGTQ